MFIIDSIQSFVDSLESNEFYKYLGFSVVIILCIVTLIFFGYSRAINNLNNRIATINSLREDVQTILTDAKKVKKQREQIDAILAQDENFKIGEYFRNTLASLQLTEKEQAVDYSHIDHSGAYRERILKAKLTDMNMKELSELLYAIEKNQRVYSKDLEIIKSRKGNLLDINLTIATLEPKSSST